MARPSALPMMARTSCRRMYGSRIKDPHTTQLIWGGPHQPRLAYRVFLYIVNPSIMKWCQASALYMQKHHFFSHTSVCLIHIDTFRVERSLNATVCFELLARARWTSSMCPTFCTHSEDKPGTQVSSMSGSSACGRT